MRAALRRQVGCCEAEDHPDGPLRRPDTAASPSEPVGKLRGRVHSYNGVPVVVTYHPAYLLRNLPEKAKAWADLCLAQDVLRQASA